jgi:titin
MNYYYYIALTDKPQAPKNVHVVEVYKDYITIAWEAPDNDGGSPIKEYIVEKADTKRRSFINAGTTDQFTTKFKVTKLYEGNEYIFQVSAVNGIGQSAPAVSEPQVAKLPFGETLIKIALPGFTLFFHSRSSEATKERQD